MSMCRGCCSVGSMKGFEAETRLEDGECVSWEFREYKDRVGWWDGRAAVALLVPILASADFPDLEVMGNMGAGSADDSSFLNEHLESTGVADFNFVAAICYTIAVSYRKK